MRAFLALTLIVSATQASARCASGMIYRPSLGICQTEAQAYRSGLRFVYIRAPKTAPRPKIIITHEQHLWNWVEANREELIRAYSRP